MRSEIKSQFCYTEIFCLFEDKLQTLKQNIKIHPENARGK